jgi:methylenetetrahydrofolate reductase (NADPH)
MPMTLQAKEFQVDSHTRMELVFSAGNTPTNVSFEFFPPKTGEMEARLWESIQQLEPMQPRFVSVTYGAGGTTRERTHHTVRRIVNETRLKPAAHLTCVGASRAEVDQVARDYWEAGVRHIVALRGDPPPSPDGSPSRYTPHPDGYAHSCDLVAGLKKIADFEITVGAYPEKHPESASLEADIDILKRKVDAGATRAISQYFFDVEHYFRFMERLARHRVTIDVVPGLLPVSNVAQLTRFSAMCGASVPQWLMRLFDGLDHEPLKRNAVAVCVAAEQARQLKAFGVNDLHFYTLNRADLTGAICHLLGKRAVR